MVIAMNYNKIQRLNELLEYAKGRNEFYRRLYNNVNLPISNVKEIPILYRDKIRKSKNEIISQPNSISELKHDQTNGTTEGKALDIYRTEQEWIACDLNLWKTRRRINRIAAQKYAFYYFNGSNFSKKHNKFSNGSYTAIQFPMMKQHIDDYVEDLNVMINEKITWIIAPPSILFTLACVAVKNNVKIEIPVIESTSEYLPNIYRSFFEAVFVGKVYVHYSCHEVWGMAFSDENGNLKIMDNVIIDEIDDDRFDNGFKKCIVTNLMVRSMPFIRYELSDLIRIDDDILYTYGFRWTEHMIVSGIDIHCSFFVNTFLKFEQLTLIPLENYQLVYTDNKIILNLINIPSNLNEPIKFYLQSKIKESYHLNIPVEILSSKRFFVDTVSGKMRGIIKHSDVNWNSEEFNFFDDVCKNYYDSLQSNPRQKAYIKEGGEVD